MVFLFAIAIRQNLFDETLADLEFKDLNRREIDENILFFRLF